MARFVLSAFADEAGRSLGEQITALHENGIRYIEPRSIDGKGILTLTDEEIASVKAELDAAGIKVNSLGSPIGKFPIQKPLSEHISDFERALFVCDALGTKNMRMFSFFIPEGERAANYTDEVIERLRALAKIATERGIRLCHENEKDIFGQNPPEVKLILDSVPEIYGIFDGANYRECGCDTIEGINATLTRLAYMHVKDAIHNPRTIVPAGEGEARLDEVIDIINEQIDGVVYLTLEPHLHIFDALKDIDSHELKNKYTFKTNREAFDFAANALKGLLRKQGYREENGEWIK